MADTVEGLVPVAWRYRYKIDRTGDEWDEWITVTVDPNDWDWAPGWHDFEAEPLYPDSALEALVVERDEARTHVEVLQNKIDPDEHCACGYDAGTDVCLHHSPIVHALEARAQAAEVERDRLRAALITIRDSFAPDSIVGARPDLGFHGFKGFKAVAREALGETK